MRTHWLCIAILTALATSPVALHVTALEPAEAPGPDALPHPIAVEPDDLLVGTEAGPRIADTSREIQAARQRLDRANARYSNMMSRNYPRGDARVAIVAERRAAEAHLRDLLRTHSSPNGTHPRPASQW
ncbi:hypothetical protein MK489_03330 [Myxococcota bacterium]|nr:hypothetical protein [Myxococcota bacterium]